MPAVIDEATYQRAGAARGERSHQPEQQLARLPLPVMCGACGEKMRRLHDARLKISESWVCACGAKVWISDAGLHAALTELLNHLITRPDLVVDGPTEEQEQPLGIAAMRNEIGRQLEGFSFDRDQVKKSIFELAALKYSLLDSQKNTSKQLRAELSQMAPLSAFSPEVLREVAGQILLGGPAAVQIKLKNGQSVGKDEHHECDGNPGQA